MSAPNIPTDPQAPIERIAITLYNVDPMMIQSFRISAIQRGTKFGEAVIEAMVAWLQANPPIAPTR